MENPVKSGINCEFGEFRLDTAQRVLFRAGRPIPLAPKVLETLLGIVERDGTLVTKDELMTRLWPDTFVEESNLTVDLWCERPRWHRRPRVDPGWPDPFHVNA